MYCSLESLGCYLTKDCRPIQPATKTLSNTSPPFPPVNPLHTRLHHRANQFGVYNDISHKIWPIYSLKLIFSIKTSLLIATELHIFMIQSSIYVKLPDCCSKTMKININGHTFVPLLTQFSVALKFTFSNTPQWHFQVQLTNKFRAELTERFFSNHKNIEILVIKFWNLIGKFQNLAADF